MLSPEPRRAIPLILEDAENGLSSRMRRTIAELYDLFNDLERRIHFFDKEIETVFRQSEACQRIAKVKGIGPKTATAVVAAIGKGTEFRMVATLLHGWVWFYASIRVATGRC